MRKQTWVMMALVAVVLTLWGCLLAQVWDLTRRLGLMLDLLMMAMMTVLYSSP